MPIVFAKLAPDIHRHPKIRKGGRDALAVFVHCLAVNADKGATGIVPASYVDPWFVADTIMCSEDEARSGLARAVAVELLELLPDGSARIVGWDDDEWGRGERPSMTEKDRKNLQRQVEREAKRAAEAVRTGDEVSGQPGDVSGHVRKMSGRPDQSESDTEAEAEADPDPESASPTGAPDVGLSDRDLKPADLTEQKPKRGKPRRLADHPHFVVAERLWSLQDRLRAEVMPGTRRLEADADRLQRVIKLLESGRTEAELEAVLRSRADDVRADRRQGKWFDGVSNWRVENVDRQLGQIGTGDHPTPAEILAAGAVLTKLAERTKIAWPDDKHAVRTVVARLRGGISAEDLWAIARYCASPPATGGLGWADDERMRPHLNPSTLFGADATAKHLTAARAWAARSRGP